MRRTLGIISILVLATGTFASAEDNQLLHTSYVNMSGEYEVTITEGDRGPRLDIIRHNHKDEVVAHYVPEAVSFDYARPSPKADHLIIVWQTGSGTFVTAFLLAATSKPQPVFAKSPDGDPEFVLVGDRQVMLFYSGRHHIGDYWIPKTACLYVWDGEQYNLLRTVPYESRFEALVALQAKHPR
jgi:hypothetical protein